MKKHAYLILVHKDLECLNNLIELLDDVRNDIFIVPDLKSPNSLVSNLSAFNSNLYILSKDQRVDIRWGTISSVEAELRGFSMILKKGHYDYLHLISGQDLPIKNQDYIHSFFDSIPSGTNMVGFAQGVENDKDLKNKTDYYHLFINHYRYPNIVIRQGLKIIRKSWVLIQKLLRIKRNWSKRIYKGCNWVSITSDFAKYLVENQDEILKLFHNVPCCDEMYKQTWIMNSSYRKTIFNTNVDFAGDTRLIDWTRGNPYVWHKEDFQLLLSSDALFARKFDSTVDKNIITLIKEHLINNSK